MHSCVHASACVCVGVAGGGDGVDDGMLLVGCVSAAHGTEAPLAPRDRGPARST